MRELDDYRSLVDEYLKELPVAAEVSGGLAEAMHYLLLAGGKRIRPVVCLATGESAGADVQDVLPAAAAVERNILRIAVHELDGEEVPDEVAIDEAVSLAKRYASEDAGRLVNGILARIQRERATGTHGR